MNQAGFAAHRRVSRKTVTGWKQRGLLVLLPDGQVDVAASDRALERHGISLPKVTALEPDDDQVTPEASLEEEARLLVSADGEELLSKAEAERLKENYAARLKQLEYDREVGLVAEIDDVVAAVASEYAIVRNRLLGIGSKVAPSVAVLNSAEEIKALIDKEVARALGALTVDVHGEQDFGKVRESIQKRFGPASEEAAPSPQ
ncbi:hypothetical protein SHLA_4c001360 [Shinella sp. DD12]|nr:hypothetical protein SHLA_4c001360 [Shinella sp. DD12]